jgi:hypothetical protein
MASYWITPLIFSLALPVSSNAYIGFQVGNVANPTAQALPAASPATQQNSAQVTEMKPADVTSSPATSAPQTKNSYLLVELSKTLNVKKLKPGAKIKAEVSQDVLSHGKIIIPAETKITGHVTEVKVRDENNPESRLGIVFDRIHLKHYHDINIQAVVQRVQPPIERKSAVDQPSQMLPPSMLTGGLRQSTATPSGRQIPGRASAGTVSQTGAYNGYTVPFTVKESPTTNAQTGSSAAELKPQVTEGQAMSVGMPYGVTGIKGLSLSPKSPETPGPVIVSNINNVKLEYGTQILLHVLNVETPQQPAK